VMTMCGNVAFCGALLTYTRDPQIALTVDSPASNDTNPLFITAFWLA